MTIDTILLVLSAVLALYTRDNFHLYLDKFSDLTPYTCVTAMVAPLTILAFGLNQSVWRCSTFLEYARIICAVFVIILVATLIVFTVNRMNGIARSIPVLHGILAIFAMTGARVLQRLWFARNLRSHDHAAVASSDQQFVLVVGLTNLTELFVRSIEEFSGEHIHIAGIVDHQERHSGHTAYSCQIFSSQKDLRTTIQDLAVHGVVINRIVIATKVNTLPPNMQSALEEIANGSSIRVDVLPDLIGLSTLERAAPVTAAPGKPADHGLTFVFPKAESDRLDHNPYWRFKRALDVVVAGSLLIVLAPFMAIIAALVAADMGFPSIFWQQRPGVHGRPFKLYKFRTMASTAFDQYGQAISDQDRLTALGQFLRLSRLDELPQLWNIFVGEMSFVGPRPLLPIDQPETFSARLLVRPGLTGWAQVMAGRDIQPADKSALDVWYVQNASLRLDCETVLRTVPMVIFGERVNQEAIQRAWEELAQRGICSRSYAQSSLEAQDRNLTVPLL